MNSKVAVFIILGFCTVACHRRLANAEIASDDAPERPMPKFTVGKETTYVSGPLDKDGYIDYAAALNERLGKGVTSENNAMVLILKAGGPRYYGERMPVEFYRLMGMNEPPEKGEYFIDLSQFLKDSADIQPDQRLKIEQQMEPIFRRPWTPMEFPSATAWLKKNEKPLGVLNEASLRSHCFVPRVKTESGGHDSGIIASLPPVQKSRSMAMALICRAMLRISERRFDDSWKDLLTAHRVAHLFGNGPTMMESLVTLAINNMVSRAELAFVERTNYDANQLRKCLSDLRALPALPSIADNVDLAERFLGLDCIMAANREGVPQLEMLLLSVTKDYEKIAERSQNKTKPKPEIQALLQDIDWDPMLRHANQWDDRVVAALREPDRAKRDSRLQALEEEEKKFEKDLPKADELAESLLRFKSDPAARGRLFVKLFGVTVELTRSIQRAVERAEQIQRNLYIAIALAAYCADQKSYPKSLDALTPKYLDKVPDDYFTGKPLVYKPDEKGYLLYSFGTNGKDDGGRQLDDDPPGDDLSVRMPVPEPKRK